jgi:hypothetical protein
MWSRVDLVKNRRFDGKYRLHLEDRKKYESKKSVSFSHTSNAIGSQMAVRLSAQAPTALYSPEILFSFFWYSFLLVAE